MKLLDIFFKEIRYLFFENRYGFLLVGTPVAYALLFGVAFSGETLKAIPTVIYDAEQSSASRSLEQDFIDSDRFDVVAIVDSQEEMEDYISADKAVAAVGIPNDFSRQIKAGIGSNVLLEVNSVNVIYANTTLTFAREITAAYNAGLGQKIVEGLDELPLQAQQAVLPVNLRIRLLYNPTSSFSSFMLPGLITNGVQLSIVLCACLALIREFNSAFLWERASVLKIIAAKLLLYWGASTLAGMTAIGICAAIFGVIFRGSAAELLLIYSAFTFVICNFGLLISALAKNNNQPVSPVVLVYLMPAFLYSGYSWPGIAQNDFAHIYSFFLPMTYTANTVRDILLAGYSGELMRNSLILYTAGLFFLLLTTIVCTRRSRLLIMQARGEMA